ncbi:MAG TPA: aldo/keto reductase [Halothiobacillaceae bacterium]|nr:aldo/keto reductase [Halothiobacillaceae bacterium]
MQYNPLGNSQIQVSEICLGTMTFGEQNTQHEANQQLDYAVAQGVNFIDTAEMYPVPPRAETQGRTEEMIGNWLVNQPREKLIIASKVTGRSVNMDYLRDGPRVNRQHIQQAIEGSLKRLKTDYIDLYQVHWPDRYVPKFGQRYYDSSQNWPDEPIEEQLTALAELVEAGKVRAIGLSNETPWGVMRFLNAAEKLNLPVITSVQNAYHLMNRQAETGGLLEVCDRENIALLPYSPLAFGHLTGKYLDNPNADGRIKQFPGFGKRYEKTNAAEATKAYVSLAREWGLSPAQMAIAFTIRLPQTPSTIIGATSLDQLQENIAAIDVNWTAELQAQIDAIDARYPSPTV